MELVFVMVFKGSYMTCFLYDEDFHSGHFLDLKNEKFKDLLGIQVTATDLSLIPQSNTYHPQFRIYNTSHLVSAEDKLATSAIFTYLSHIKTLRSISDDFKLPSNGKSDIIVGKSTLPHQVGLSLTLKLDHFGNFKHT